MARPNKAGLDYFELDCHLNEKVRLVQAEFGLKGFAIVVKLYQKIFGELGYYCEWNEDSLLLFMSENGVLSRDERNLINEIVSACIRRNIFSEYLFKKYGILTSEWIQERYLNAASRRERIDLKKEYLLLSDVQKQQNVVINSINVSNNSINVSNNPQSRVEKSKVENINNMCKVDILMLFDRLWKLYPLKRGKGQISNTQKVKLFEIGFDEMNRAIQRYKEYVEGSDYLHYQNGSTFFNSGYIDYLDNNYTPVRVPGKTQNIKKNNFNKFSQREYDYDNLEKQLLGKEKSNGI